MLAESVLGSGSRKIELWGSFEIRWYQRKGQLLSMLLGLPTELSSPTTQYLSNLSNATS